MNKHAQSGDSPNVTIEEVTTPPKRLPDYVGEYHGPKPTTGDRLLSQLCELLHQQRGGSRTFYMRASGPGILLIWQRQQGDNVTIELSKLHTQTNARA